MNLRCAHSNCAGLWVLLAGHKIPAIQWLASTMLKLFILVFGMAQLLLPSAEAQVYKCNINGAVQYQQSPCESNEGRKPPTAEEFNAQRQKQLAQEEARPSTQKPQARPLATPESFEQAPANPLASSRTSFKCDGRKYCTQMTSCKEAKYFLSNCPGVKMDGDRDGIPCEEQWCTP